MSVAKILERTTHQVPGKLSVSEIFFSVPLDYSKPGNGSLRLFARSVERFEKLVDVSKKEVKQQPWFVYLQGGPGMSSKDPYKGGRLDTGLIPGILGLGRPPQYNGWTDFVLDKGYQILFLDQRGTGLSSTVTAKSLSRNGASPTEQAAYLKHFRADSIVRDCEAIRKSLTADFPEEKKKWTIMGQSFGGFCCINYLSRFPEGLQDVFTTGGLPPLVKQPDVVLQKLFVKVRERNQAYYQKYPEDNKSVKTIIHYLGVKASQKENIILPSGTTMSILRLRQLGILFGFHGYLDVVHDMIFRLVNDLEDHGEFTRPTLAAFEAASDFNTVILYALVHEPLYCQGTASDWSADRVIKCHPDFVNVSTDSKEPIYFVGEMVFKQFFDDFDELRPLKETADILAKADDWPDLYDEEQLAKNEVPVYSATFVDDMYVDFGFAQETASKIKNCKTFITNVMYHDALGTSKNDQVLKQLFALRDDTID